MKLNPILRRSTTKIMDTKRSELIKITQGNMLLIRNNTIDIVYQRNRVIIMNKIITSHKERAPRVENITKIMIALTKPMLSLRTTSMMRVLIKNHHPIVTKATVVSPPRKRITKSISIQTLINKFHQVRII